MSPHCFTRTILTGHSRPCTATARTKGTATTILSYSRHTLTACRSRRTVLMPLFRSEPISYMPSAIRSQKIGHQPYALTRAPHSRASAINTVRSSVTQFLLRRPRTINNSEPDFINLRVCGRPLSREQPTAVEARFPSSFGRG